MAVAVWHWQYRRILWELGWPYICGVRVGEEGRGRMELPHLAIYDTASAHCNHGGVSAVVVCAMRERPALMASLRHVILVLQMMIPSRMPINLEEPSYTLLKIIFIFH